MIVILSHYLRQDVEAAGADDEILDIGQLLDGLGGSIQIPGHADADHGGAGKAHLQWIGYGDDLHHTRVQEALDPLSHGRFRQPDRLADGAVGAPAVGLEFLDDRLGDVVEDRGFG